MTSEELARTKEYKKRWRDTHRKERAEYQNQWVKDNPKKWNAVMKRYRDKLKAEVMAEYGGKCEICGETDIDKLSIDHSWNNGQQHRRQLFGTSSTSSGWRFYQWLRTNGYPKNLGLRVLCMSCNAKATKGIRKKRKP